MSNNVIFEEDSESIARHVPVSAKPTLMTKLVYRTGLAKTPKGAQYVLLAVAFICLFLTFLALYAGGVA